MHYQWVCIALVAAALPSIAVLLASREEPSSISDVENANKDAFALAVSERAPQLADVKTTLEGASPVQAQGSASGWLSRTQSTSAGSPSLTTLLAAPPPPETTAESASSDVDSGKTLGVALRSVILTEAQLGTPAASSTSDCGASSGTIPTLPAGRGAYTQVGCSNPLYSSITVDFTLVQTYANFVGVCLISGDACKSPSKSVSDCIGGGLSLFTTSGTHSYSGGCSGSTCCVIIVCESTLFECSSSTWTYSATFAGALNVGIIAGIVAAVLVPLCVFGCICRNCPHILCCRKPAVEPEGHSRLLDNSARVPAVGRSAGMAGSAGMPTAYAPQGFQAYSPE